MNREERLVKNTIIYAIGNLGSRILSFLIVPLYSYYITTEDMGTYDLIITTVMLVAPLITMQMNDGVYRWLIDSEEDKDEVIKTATHILVRNMAFFVLAYLISIFIFQIPYPVATLFYAVSYIPYGYLQQVTRGLGYNEVYSYCGVICTFIMLLCNLIGLVVLKQGVETLLYSYIVAFVVCIVIFVIKIRIWEYFTPPVNQHLKKELLVYSIPLIPNVICWWIVNSVDRYTILYFLGKDDNGIFSIASKYPAAITTITAVFFLAWQESAIKEYDSPGRNQFFSNVLKKYTRLLFTTVIVCLPAIKVFFMLVMEQSYKDSWQYTGFLFIGTAFNALSAFLGTAYNISKDTKMALYTTLAAALVDVILNVLLMPIYGLQVASFSTFVAYIVLFTVRIINTRKYFNLTINWLEFAALVILSLVTMTGTFVLKTKICAILTIILLIIWFIYNRTLWMRIVNPVLVRLMRGRQPWENKDR